MSSKSTDAETEELKRRFASMETYAEKLHKDATAFRDSITSMVDSSVRYSDAFLAIFTPMGNEHSLESRYPAAASTIQQIGGYQTEMADLKEALKPEIELIESRVIAPAKELMDAMKKIKKFITKRDHKLIDYDRHNNSYTKLRDKQNKSLSDEKNLFKLEQDFEQASQDYEQYNNSLKQDLPRFFQLATQFISPLFDSFYYMQLQCVYVMLEKYHQIANDKFDMSVDIEAAYRAKLGDAAEQVESLQITKRVVSTAHFMKNRVASGGSSTLGRANSTSSTSTGAADLSSKPSFSRTLPPSTTASTTAAAPPPYTAGSTTAAAGISKRPPPPPPGKKPVSAAPTCVALYDYEAQAHGDLSFNAGETIEIIQKTDNAEDWWTGRIGSREGQFPANYVQLQ